MNYFNESFKLFFIDQYSSPPINSERGNFDRKCKRQETELNINNP